MSDFGKVGRWSVGVAITLGLVIPALGDEANGSFTGTATFSGANALSNPMPKHEYDTTIPGPQWNFDPLNQQATGLGSAPSANEFDVTGATASAFAPPSYYSSIDALIYDFVTITNSSGSAQTETINVSGPLSLAISGNNALDAATLRIDVKLLEADYFTIDDEAKVTYSANTVQDVSTPLQVTLPAGATDTFLVSFTLTATAAQDAVPEPASLLLIGPGLAFLFALRRRLPRTDK